MAHASRQRRHAVHGAVAVDECAAARATRRHEAAQGREDGLTAGEGALVVECDVHGALGVVDMEGDGARRARHAAQSDGVKRAKLTGQPAEGPAERLDGGGAHVPLEIGDAQGQAQVVGRVVAGRLVEHARERVAAARVEQRQLNRQRHQSCLPRSCLPVGVEAASHLLDEPADVVRRGVGRCDFAGEEGEARAGGGGMSKERRHGRCDAATNL